MGNVLKRKKSMSSQQVSGCMHVVCMDGMVCAGSVCEEMRKPSDAANVVRTCLWRIALRKENGGNQSTHGSAKHVLPRMWTRKSARSVGTRSVNKVSSPISSGNRVTEHVSVIRVVVKRRQQESEDNGNAYGVNC